MLKKIKVLVLLFLTSIMLIGGYTNCSKGSKQELVLINSSQQPVVDDQNQNISDQCAVVEPQSMSVNLVNTNKKYSDVFMSHTKQKDTSIFNILNTQESQKSNVLENGLELDIKINDSCHVNELLFSNLEIRYSTYKDKIFKAILTKDVDQNILIDELNKISCIQFVDIHSKDSLLTIDPNRAYQLHLPVINFNQVETRIYNPYNGINQKIKVAVVDSGIEMNHTDIKNNIAKDASGNPIYWSCSQCGDPNIDYPKHGTHVAGLIAAEYDNGIGVTGVMGKSIEIYNAKSFYPTTKADGTLDTVNLQSDTLAGFSWASNQKVDIINMSFGQNRSTPSELWVNELNKAMNNGILLVAAAGNEAHDLALNPMYPANLSTSIASLISVAAVNTNDSSLSGFSNFSSSIVDIAAPGSSNCITNSFDSPCKGILSLYTGGAYGYKAGTSMAAPVVSGALAMMKGLLIGRGFNPSVSQMKKIFLNGARLNEGLASKVIGGRQLDLKYLVDYIDRQTGIDSFSNVDRSQAGGNIEFKNNLMPTNAVIGTKVKLRVDLTESSTLLVKYQWYINGVEYQNDSNVLIYTPTTEQDFQKDIYVKVISGKNVIVSNQIKLNQVYKFCQ